MNNFIIYILIILILIGFVILTIPKTTSFKPTIHHIFDQEYKARHLELLERILESITDTLSDTNTDKEKGDRRCIQQKT